MEATVFLIMQKKYINSKQKTLEIKPYLLCLGNIKNNFTVNKMKKKTGLNGYVFYLSIDYNIIDVSNIINIHKYLMKKHNIK